MSQLNGYLDTNDGLTVQGWAFDRSQPDAAVDVEVQLSSGFSITVTADEFRSDLLEHGVGNGMHAFSVKLPEDTPQIETTTITARIKGTDFSLRGSPMALRPQPVIGLLAGDIVNNCNLRCPFCMVDYTNIRGLKLMTRETFDRAASLLPLMQHSFWLSCLHEPSLHPQFLDYVESVPAAHRRKLSFTTNLSRRVPDAYLERLSNSGIGSIRISFDSRQPDLFEELRKNAKFAIFQENLDKLTRFLAVSRNRPNLHFITMAFRTNVDEIPSLIRYCKESLGGNSHEVRFIYYGPHLAKWGQEHMLSVEEWTKLEKTLSPLRSYTELTIFGPLEHARDQFAEEEGLKEYISRETAFGGSEDTSSLAAPRDPSEIGAQLADEPIRLRLRWDGLMMLEQYPDSFFKVNLHQLSDPVAYFGEMRRAARNAVKAAAI